MTSRKKRKKTEEDRLEIIESCGPTLQGDRAANHENFRRDLDAYVEGETRAFEALRSAAERHVIAPPPTLPAPPMEDPISPDVIARADQPCTRWNRAWLTVLLYASFALFGGLVHHLWQQGARQSRVTSSSLAGQVATKSKGSELAKTVEPTPCAASDASTGETRRANTRVATPVASADQALDSVQPQSSSEQRSDPTGGAALAGASALPSLQHPQKSIPVASHLSKRALILRAQGGEIRRGPGLQYKIVGVLPVGQWVEGKLSSDHQWLRIAEDQFLASRFLLLTEHNPKPILLDRWVKARKVNVRALPTLDAQVIRQFQEGDALKVLSIHPEWGLLSTGGYIYLSLLGTQAPRSPVPTAPPAPASMRQDSVRQTATPAPSQAQVHFPTWMRVVPPEARIHSGPGAQYQAIGVFFKEHKVEVIELKDGWFRVGANQFVRRQDLETPAQTPLAPRM